MSKSGATEIPRILETKNASDSNREKVKRIPAKTYQLNIFEGLADDLQKIKEHLFQVEINALTPVEALMKLNELKEIVKNYQ